MFVFYLSEMFLYFSLVIHKSKSCYVGAGIHQVDLPLVANESQAKRLWNRQGHAFVGVAFDCNTQNVFWTDVSGRSIYSAPIDNMDHKRYVVRTGLRSPEG